MGWVQEIMRIRMKTKFDMSIRIVYLLIWEVDFKNFGFKYFRWY